MPKKSQTVQETSEELKENLTIDSVGKELGIGAITLRKLKDAGYTTLKDLAFASVRELGELVGSEERAKKIIFKAQEILGIKPFKTAFDYYQERKSIKRISTGCRALDELLEGGIETKAITEFVGEFGSGKTQICHQLAVMVQLPPEKGGLGAKALYIDTEGTFRPERIIEIAKYRGLDPEKALSNIIYARAVNSDQQIMLVEKARELIRKENIKLIIVDSLITHFRAEYPGRENLAPRQQKLNYHINQLMKIADIYNVAVVVTNQVIAQPDLYTGGTRPAGGHVVAHGCTYRIWLRKGKENIRIAKIFDSPYHPEREVTFRITEHGVVD